MTQLPPHPYDIVTISQIRASRQFRVTLETNRYSIPAEYAGAGLTFKTYPDRLCIYYQNKLVARHVRSYDMRKDIELPDHPKALLDQRREARDQKIFMRFLSLSDKADAYYRQLEQRRMNPLHHIRQIVDLSEIYSDQSVQGAMEDAFLPSRRFLTNTSSIYWNNAQGNFQNPLPSTLPADKTCWNLLSKSRIWNSTTNL